jgi:phage terminase large subunit
VTIADFPPKLEPLFNPSRYKILYGGRGAAKSWGIARALLLLGSMRPLRVLCAREIQLSISDSVHHLLADQVDQLGLGHFYNVQHTTIIGANGTEFIFTGLRQQDIGKIKSFEGIDICWVEEGQAVTKKSWDVLTPTIRKEQSEIWVSFNPELEEDEAYARFVTAKPTNAQIININWRDNPWFPQVLEDERLDCLKRDPESYETIWEGKCRSTVAGAIFATELKAAREAIPARICAVPYDPVLPVNTYWDLGVGDATAIWFEQHIGAEVRLIDYYEAQGEGLPHYAKVLSDRKYNYGKHWAPHDIQVREFGSGRSRIEVAAQLGIKFNMVPRAGSGEAEALEERIHASRMIFPRCWFDADKTRAGLKALASYRRDYNARLEEFKATPVHDWASHGADAFGHMAVSLRTVTEAKPYVAQPKVVGGWLS